MEAEADENLDLEAEDLLGFADGLDFDKMVGRAPQTGSLIGR